MSEELHRNKLPSCHSTEAFASEKATTQSNANRDTPPAQDAHSGDDVKMLRERLARVSAELENYRKRARRELEDLRKYAQTPLMIDLLPVIDNLRHAMDAAEIASDPDDMLSGIHMIYDQLQEILVRHDCHEVAAAGEKFDPAVHEAIRQMSVPGKPAGMVVDVIQPGYQLYERVIRPARVLVSGDPPPEEPN